MAEQVLKITRRAPNSSFTETFVVDGEIISAEFTSRYITAPLGDVTHAIERVVPIALGEEERREEEAVKLKLPDIGEEAVIDFVLETDEVYPYATDVVVRFADGDRARVKIEFPDTGEGAAVIVNRKKRLVRAIYTSDEEE